MNKKRTDVYPERKIILEELEFGWEEKDMAKTVSLWNGGAPFADIVKGIKPHGKFNGGKERFMGMTSDFNIEDILRSYKVKKSYVETTMARIDQYKYAIEHPDEWYKDYVTEGKEPGMPGKPRGGFVGDTMSMYICNKTLTVDILKDWVSDDESRIFLLKLEVQQIDIALERALTNQERYIVELKYFEKMFWKEIERNFNDKFRQKNYISDEGLKKINRDALYKLENVLKPFYNQYNTFKTA